jgi:hypothetical protein
MFSPLACSGVADYLYARVVEISGLFLKGVNDGRKGVGKGTGE